MAGTINDFRSSFKTDLARPARFDVLINIPLVLLPYVATARQLSYRCETADLPGRSLATTERKIGSAPVQKVPNQSVYNESNMTFIVSDDMSEKILFEGWMEAINPSSSYNFRYKANYVTDIIISQYDVSNQLTYQVQLIDAFPVSINQLDLDWSSDGHHKLTVTFAYTNWTSTMVNQIAKNLGTQAISGLIGTLESNIPTTQGSKDTTVTPTSWTADLGSSPSAPGTF